MRIENSFLPVRGVGEVTERKLWEAGVTHWDEFGGQVVGSTVADRITEYIETRRPHLERGDLAPIAADLPSGTSWRLFENAEEQACYLDIETTGLDPGRHSVTTVSVHVGGETRTFVAGRDPIERELETVLGETPLLVTYNGARFDVPFLQQSFDLSIDVPHLDLLYPSRRLGLDGGLSGVERALGIDRTLPDVDGADAVRLWREYERGREEALETLVTYNREDTEVLVDVAETVCGRLHEQVFVNATPRR